MNKKRWYLRWYMWILYAFLIVIIFSINSASNKAKQVAQDFANRTSTATQPSPAPVASQTLLEISGSGSKTTQKFTAGGDWDLNWSYDCSNFGMDGNLQVFVYDGDGNLSFRHAGVNQLGAKDTGVESYHSGGTFYLVVNSMCKWVIEAKG